MSAIGRRGFLVGLGATMSLAAPVRGQPVAPRMWRIPLTLTQSRVVIDCSIAGQGPYPFVLDTGGTIGLIAQSLVDRLKLRKLGLSPLRLKIGRKPYPIYEATDVVFGGQLRQPSAAFAGVEQLNFRDGAVGSLAAGLLTAGNSEIDFEARELRIYPDAAPERTGWIRSDKAIVSYGNRNGSSFLLADATLGGKAFRFGVDTGWPSAMQIYRKTAEAVGIWDAPRWSPTGQGGKARLVRAPALGLGGATIDGVLLAIVETPEWDLFDEGIIGLPILKLFDMATAPAEQALYLKRNRLTAEPERYNRAGLWVDRDGKDAKIAVVGAGSPAAGAGLKPGDRLIDVDFGALVEKMFGPAGTHLALTVEDAAGRRQLDLVLADYL
jgi:hypothetical protein